MKFWVYFNILSIKTALQTPMISHQGKIHMKIPTYKGKFPIKNKINRAKFPMKVMI